MILKSCFMDDRPDQTLAVVDVESDEAIPWGEDHVKRKIVGTVRRRGPVWDEFFDFWTRIPLEPFVDDGKNFCTVRGLHIDHDYYAFWVAMSLDGGKISIQTVEHLHGTLDEFKEEVCRRNKRIQDYYDKFDNGTLTPNDIREWEGYPRLDHAYLNTPIHREGIEELRKLRERRPEWNTIV
jgi:hypothetical protein